MQLEAIIFTETNQSLALLGSATKSEGSLTAVERAAAVVVGASLTHNEVDPVKSFLNTFQLPQLGVTQRFIITNLAVC